MAKGWGYLSLPFGDGDKRWSCSRNEEPPCNFDLCEECFNDNRCNKDGFSYFTSAARESARKGIGEEKGSIYSDHTISEKGQCDQVDKGVISRSENDAAVVSKREASGSPPSSDTSPTTFSNKSTLHSPLSLIVFSRRDAKEAIHSVSIFLGKDKINLESTLRDVMVKGKELNKAIFRSKTKGFIMEVKVSDTETIPITISSARERKISDLLNINRETGKTLHIMVKDAPEIDDNENDVEF